MSSGISPSRMVSVLVTLASRHCLLVCTSTEIKTHPYFPVFQSIHSLFSTLPKDSCQHSALLTHDYSSPAAAVPRNTPELPVTVHVWPDGLVTALLVLLITTIWVFANILMLSQDVECV